MVIFQFRSREYDPVFICSRFASRGVAVARAATTLKHVGNADRAGLRWLGLVHPSLQPLNGYLVGADRIVGGRAGNVRHAGPTA